MDQNQKIFSQIPGFAGNAAAPDAADANSAQLQNALQNMLKQASTSAAPTLELFAQLQQRRAERSSNLAKDLIQQVGKDDNNVAALKGAADSIAKINTTINSETARIKSWPRLHANEWAVFGTVVNADGKPASGLTVRVFDRDRKYDDLLGETETGPTGEFSITYHERDFAETGEKLPELYVMISDTNGASIYSTRDQIRFEAGKSEYFAIVLPPPGQTPPAPKPRRAKK